MNYRFQILNKKSSKESSLIALIYPNTPEPFELFNNLGINLVIFKHLYRILKLADYANFLVLNFGNHKSGQ